MSFLRLRADPRALGQVYRCNTHRALPARSTPAHAQMGNYGPLSDCLAQVPDAGGSGAAGRAGTKADVPGDTAASLLPTQVASTNIAQLQQGYALGGRSQRTQ